MEKIIRINRMMAFERAKGELRSILITFTSNESEKYAAFKEAMTKFIDDVNDNGLVE